MAFPEHNAGLYWLHGQAILLHGQPQGTHWISQACHGYCGKPNSFKTKKTIPGHHLVGVFFNHPPLMVGLLLLMWVKQGKTRP